MQANFQAYQPATSTEATVNAGIRATESAQRTSQITSDAKKQRVSEIINSVQNIAKSGAQINQTREDSILRNFQFSKTLADNQFEDQLAKIDLDESKPAIEKANAKKALTDTYRTQSGTMIENLKKNNTFILGKSDMNVGQWEEANKQYFNNLDNKLQGDIIKINNDEADLNATNSTNNLSSLSSVEAIRKDTNAIVQYWQTRPGISAAEREGAIQGTLQKANQAEFDHNVTRFNTTAENNPTSAIQQVDREIARLRGNESYLPSLKNKGDRIKELQGLKSGYESALKSQTASAAATKITLDYTSTPEQALEKLKKDPLFAKAETDGDIETIDKMKSKVFDRLNQRENKTADFTAQNIGSDNPQDIQRIQEYNGYSHKSSLTDNNAALFKLSYESNGKDIIGGDGNPLNSTQKLDRFILEQRAVFGSNKGVLKEAKLHLDPLDALALEARIRETSNANELAQISAEKNKQGGLGIIKKEKEEASAISDYYDTNRGKSLRMVDRVAAEKEAKAFYQISARTGKSIDDIAKEMQGSNIYLVDESTRQNITFDSSKYNEDEVKYGIKELRRNPDKYLNMEDIALTQGEKFDMRGHSVVSLDGENIYLQLGVNDKLGKPLIGKIKMSDLPQKPLPVLNSEKFDLSIESIQAETERKNAERAEKQKFDQETKDAMKKLKQENPLIEEEYKFKKDLARAEKVAGKIEEGAKGAVELAGRAGEAVVRGVEKIGTSLSEQEERTRKQREIERKLRKGV